MVRRSLRVGCGPEEAFDRFTSGIGEWWPLRAGYSFGADRCDTIHLEPRVGGRFFERFVDGDELEVGAVMVCDRPSRLVFTWAPPVWPGATEVEVRFTADGDRATTIDLEHRGFEHLRDAAEDIHARFRNGWITVLDAYARHVADVSPAG